MSLQVIGWENIELISDRPLETMLDEFKRLKAEFPGRHVRLRCELHEASQGCLYFNPSENRAAAESLGCCLEPVTRLIRQES